MASRVSSLAPPSAPLPPLPDTLAPSAPSPQPSMDPDTLAQMEVEKAMQALVVQAELLKVSTFTPTSACCRLVSSHLPAARLVKESPAQSPLLESLVKESSAQSAAGRWNLGFRLARLRMMVGVQG